LRSTRSCRPYRGRGYSCSSGCLLRSWLSEQNLKNPGWEALPVRVYWRNWWSRPLSFAWTFTWLTQRFWGPQVRPLLNIKSSWKILKKNLFFHFFSFSIPSFFSYFFLYPSLLACVNEWLYGLDECVCEVVCDCVIWLNVIYKNFLIKIIPISFYSITTQNI
jgi:hypothetical protein